MYVSAEEEDVNEKRRERTLKVHGRLFLIDSDLVNQIVSNLITTRLISRRAVDSHTHG